MNDVILFGHPIASWAIPAATFVFGLACGWLGWSGQNRRKEHEDDASARVRLKAERLNADVADASGERTAGSEQSSAEGEAKENHEGDQAEFETQRPTVDPVQLQALELELRKAREALEAAEDADTGLAEEISALDEAVNRANGRLKIVARSVRKIINKS
jgi:hypothetical protein